MSTLARTKARRRTLVARISVIGGCYTCHGGDSHWYGGNAQGVAARHHDATGHETWVETVWGIRYGGSDNDPRKDGE